METTCAEPAQEEIDLMDRLFEGDVTAMVSHLLTEQEVGWIRESN